MRPPDAEGGRPKVGGQAIIEGVMMRSPNCVSAVVRLPDGEIAQKIWWSQAWHKRNKFTGWPIVRGVVSLAEALVLGIKTLNWSADIALEHEKGSEPKKKKERSPFGLVLTMVFAFGLALGLFMYVPYLIAGLLHADKNQPLFHLVAGSTRIFFFLVYIWLISLLSDVRRVFQYHGAEHQAIYTYEQGKELNPENARSQSRFHPRCGTSYLLIVALLTMVIFVIFDIIVVAWWGTYPSAFVRLLVHLPFLPLVAGISYELLRLSDRMADSPFFKMMIAPGLALQTITTRPPDDSQREIALIALKSALQQQDSEPFLRTKVS
ncbi:MAG: DUF1385 domain-containing protein [bacterium]|nr:DUF1385 domain-containing protein [bacterium]